ncbi:MAG: aminotransferase class I/II-fold pyridoxal phosphate-dependent enzyme [Clostridia bacterium]|nr:MAG: aminotransferase class I/II-fold pyridoxal phosphate-dependent enzyme [Clostridia bacterium]
MKSVQNKAPLFTAVKNYVAAGIVPFHVPGHKQGRGLPAFREYVGEATMAMDLTCLPYIDNLCNPSGVIKEAEALAAEAFGADHAFFLVNGTTSGIQAMILTVCQPGDKIIVPRNAHKSVLGGLIISGACPVYVNPEVNHEFGISMGITPEAVEWALQQHPDARAVLVIHPNYYGTTSDLAGIVRVSHSFGVPVLVDEAHGGHFGFHPDLPPSAMEVGADMVASSTHKLLGSLTQSSMLLLREGLISPSRLKAVLNLTQTTSPSYLLLCSLDAARQQMATSGRELLDQVLARAAWVRQELSCIPGINLLDTSVAGTAGCKELDLTKIVVNVRNLGISGYQMESILRQQYRLQVELADLYNVLNLITIGDTWDTVKLLVEAIKDIASLGFDQKLVKLTPHLPRLPQVSVLPREAFYGETVTVPLSEAAGETSGEIITAYPPGIPLICPGETITQEIIDYICFLKKENADLQGLEDETFEQIKVLRHVEGIGHNLMVGEAG